MDAPDKEEDIPQRMAVDQAPRSPRARTHQSWPSLDAAFDSQRSTHDAEDAEVVRARAERC